MDKNKKTVLPIILFILGIILSAAIASFSFVKQQEVKKINKERYDIAYKKSEKLVKEAKNKLDSISTELDNLKEQETMKEMECVSIDFTTQDGMMKKSACETEKINLTSRISSLEMEKKEIENGNYVVYYDKLSVKKYNKLYVIAAIVFLGFMILSLLTHIIKKNKKTKEEIVSYEIKEEKQPVIPLEEVTPEEKEENINDDIELL